MKFVCLVYIDSDAIGALSEAEGRQLADDSIAFDWGLRDSGKLILAQPLEAQGTAVTVRQRAGKFSRTDGPFVEAKEHLGGFFMIEAAASPRPRGHRRHGRTTGRCLHIRGETTGRRLCLSR